MTEDIVKENFYGRLSGNVFLTDEKTAFYKLSKEIDSRLNYNIYAVLAGNILTKIFDFCKSPKGLHDSKIFNKARVLSQFSYMNLSGYCVDKVFDIWEENGFLYKKIVFPHKGTDPNHGVISYQYFYYENPKNNPHFNCKKGYRKLRAKLKKENAKKFLSNNSLNEMKDYLKDSAPINNVENNTTNEFNEGLTDNVDIANELYTNSIFNPLSTLANLFKINFENDITTDYYNIVKDDMIDAFYEEDDEILAGKGYNIILKSTMNYEEGNLKENKKHADNLIKKFSNFESANNCVSSLWKFKTSNPIFCNDLNRSLSDDKEFTCNRYNVIYPNNSNKSLQITDDIEELTLQQRHIKNTYFINFCYMLGSYLYSCNNGIVREDNKPYSDGMLSYQDINAFTNLFKNMPWLIYLPINSDSMNFLGKLFKQQQESYRK